MAIAAKDTTDTNYFSSARAAQISGYTQDYVGQLCRDGRVVCKRQAGEWQVQLSSLLAYKQRFSPEEKLAAPQEVATKGTLTASESHEAAFEHDGVQYISSAEATKLTGYTQDYIGQLARSGAVKARKEGRKWFVSKDALVEHKEHNDSLLAAVQAQAAGITRLDKPQASPLEPPKSVAPARKIPIVTYQREDGALIPGASKVVSQPAPAAVSPLRPEVATMPQEAPAMPRKDVRLRRQDTVRTVAKKSHKTHTAIKDIPVSHAAEAPMLAQESAPISVGRFALRTVFVLLCGGWFAAAALYPAQLHQVVRSGAAFVGLTLPQELPVASAAGINLFAWSERSTYYEQ